MSYLPSPWTEPLRKKYVNETLSKTALYNLRISVFKAEGGHSPLVCSRERKGSHPSTEKAGKEPWLVRGQTTFAQTHAQRLI